MEKKYVIGIDYGTDSVRSLIVDAFTGDEIATSVKYYPRWQKGMYCDPAKNQYRQHPLDYLEVLEQSVNEALLQCDSNVAKNVVGISVDTTGSTPVFTDEKGTPLALCSGFEDNPNAMFILWKDHTAVKEAEEINLAARKSKVDYTKYVGGIYSSEWVWAKTLHVLRNDENVRQKAVSWIEHCDWIPAILTGKTENREVIRGRCSAGHKAMWHKDWNGLPPEDFLESIDSRLKPFFKNLYSETYPSDIKVGYLTDEWLKRLGMSGKVAVGAGGFDCHFGAVGGGVTPNVLARAIGTSTCDIMTARYEDIGNKLIAGICGQVDGSVIPGYIGLEAGQSAFGDIYAWFKNVISWPVIELLDSSELVQPSVKEKLKQEILDRIIPELSKKAAEIPLEESTIIAVDWMNGRRTPDANQEIKGAIAGLTLGSDAPRIFRALVEATAFGSKAIIERFKREGVEIKEVIGLGGVAKKSPFVMQTLADVLNMPIKIATTEQTCAFGAAMFAATVGGIYKNVEEAQVKMGKGFEKTYIPNKALVSRYDKLYEKYLKFGNFIETMLTR
ncbi:MAG: ribulokinase [Bacteroidales bacterium]